MSPWIPRSLAPSVIETAEVSVSHAFGFAALALLTLALLLAGKSRYHPLRSPRDEAAKINLMYLAVTFAILGGLALSMAGIACEVAP